MKELMYNLEENFNNSLNQWKEYLDSFSAAQDAMQLKMVNLLQNLEILSFEVELKEFEMEFGLKYARTVQKMLVRYNGNEFALTTHDSSYLSENWDVDGEFTDYHNYKSFRIEDVFELTNEEADVLRWLIGRSGIEMKIRQYHTRLQHNQNLINLKEEKIEILLNEDSRKKYLASLEDKKDYLQRKQLVIGILNAPVFLGAVLVCKASKKASTLSRVVKIARIPLKGVQNKLERVDEELDMIYTIELQKKEKTKN